MWGAVPCANRDGAPGITWIRRLMELISGRSLLPLSKCLEWERPGWGLTWRVPHGCLHHPPPAPCPPSAHSLVQLRQEKVQAPQLLKQLCKCNGASSVQAMSTAAQHN